jgi:EAL domain-containing protein (putative c-di-GMP-specific phosphodiesterase class I)
MNVHSQALQITERDLRRALSDGLFELDYQPVVNLCEARISGCEALVRWPHPVRGHISPSEFVPLAEKSGLIEAIGEWVLQQACAEAARWPEDVRIATNLSPAQFNSDALVSSVRSALAQAGLAPHRLELEITESMLLICNEKTISTLHQLRGLGVHIAMDDFGTGYSSLSYLRAFPFDKLKIDRSFVRDLGESDRSTAIVKAVIGLGSGLGVATVAEGIETVAQLEQLKEYGCDEVQGYLFSPPLPASDMRQYLKTWRPNNFATYLSFLLPDDDLPHAEGPRC